MRILPPARRILSREERKLVHPALCGRILVLLLVLTACTRPAPPAPAQPGGGQEAQAPGAPGPGAPGPGQAEAPGPGAPGPGPGQAALNAGAPAPAESAAPRSPAPASPAAQRPAPAPAPAPGLKYRAGIWLESRWIDSRSSDGAVAQLVQDLAARGITDLYVRTGSLSADGSISLPSATRVAAMRRETARRGLRLWAWLPGLRHRIDLSAGATRRAAASATARLASTGFDGIQLDLEPTPDDDDGYLLLLDAIREALPAGKLLGAATHLVRPHPARAEWTPQFFAAVARRLDQVAVMAYDTYARTPEEFRQIVTYQTEVALAHSPRTTEILIGVPTYEDRTERHTPETEPPWAGLAGVADGLRRASPQGRTAGWALYAHFTTSAAEWRLFRERPR